MKALLVFLAILAGSMPLILAAATEPLPDGVSQNLTLAPGDNNPRNSEGDFIRLKDGHILFVYSHFTGGKGRDATAYLASRASSDQGQTWSDHDETVVDSTADGVPFVFSVSLLRLRADCIALFYLVKKAEDDCRLVMRTSTDEAKTWSAARLCTAGPASFLVTNGRVVRLKSGRIIFPAARHDRTQTPDAFRRGAATCFYSDDEGATWRESAARVEAPAKSHSGMQHPVLVELKDGRLMMLMSMHLNPLLRSFSTDGGNTWSAAEKTGLLSPVSPVSLKRLPSTGDLLLVWNDHSDVAPAQKNSRTPLTAAISADDGVTWSKRRNLYQQPDGDYGHVAMEVSGERLLLGHSATPHARGAAGMATTVITSFDVGWLYR